MKFFPHPLLFCVACLLGCENIPTASTPVAVEEFGADVRCLSDADCKRDETCLADYCVYSGGEPYPVALRMTYPDALDRPMTHYRDFVPGESLGDVAYPPTIGVGMSVTFGGMPLTGTASFSPVGAWKSLEDSQSYLISDVMTPIDIQAGTYNITFFPASGKKLGVSLPTMYFDGIDIRTGKNLIFDIMQNTVDFQENGWWSGYFVLTYAWTETVQAGSAKPGDSETGEVFVPTSTLRIADVSSPAAVSIPLDASCDTPNCFTTVDLPLPPQRYGTTRKYVVTAIQRLSSTLRLTTRLKEFSIPLNNIQDVLGMSDLVTEFVFSPVLVEKKRGQILVPSAQSAANGLVSVSAQSADGIYSWTSIAHSAASSDGYFTFDVPVLDSDFVYTVNVQFDASHALASESFTFHSLDELLAIDVTPKTTLSGVVYGPTGAPLANAVLCFTPDNTDVSTTIEATTDERGFYTVALNHRAYALSIAPSKSAGIASLFTDVVITDSTPRSLDFTLRHTNLMFGRSLDDHGNARANVRAEAFTRSSSGKVTKMATAMSDENGIFRLFVPSFDVDSAPVF